MESDVAQFNLRQVAGGPYQREVLPELNKQSLHLGMDQIGKTYLPEAITNILNDLSGGITYSSRVSDLLNFCLFSNYSTFDLEEATIQPRGTMNTVPDTVVNELMQFTMSMFNHKNLYKQIISRVAYLPLMEDTGVVPAMANPYRITYESNSIENPKKVVSFKGVVNLFKLYYQNRILSHVLTLPELLELRELSTSLLIVALKHQTRQSGNKKNTITVQLDPELQSDVKHVKDDTWHQISWAMFLLYLIDLLVSPVVPIPGSDDGV